MNSSYNEVLQASTSTWRFQRLELVLEFSKKQIVPFHIPMLCMHVIAVRLSKLFCLDSLYTFLNDSTINSDLQRLLRAFPQEYPKEGLDYDDMYSDDETMAGLFNDIHGEQSWISWFEQQKDENTGISHIVTHKADFTRDCAELVMAMLVKLVDRQKEEDAHDAELHALEGAGRHLSTIKLEVCRLKKQLGSDISFMKGEILRLSQVIEKMCSSRTNEEQLERELEETRAEKKKQEQLLLAKCQQHTEIIAALKSKLTAKTRLRPLPPSI
jgi:hypothetical protein